MSYSSGAKGSDQNRSPRDSSTNEPWMSGVYATLERQRWEQKHPVLGMLNRLSGGLLRQVIGEEAAAYEVGPLEQLTAELRQQAAANGYNQRQNGDAPLYAVAPQPQVHQPQPRAEVTTAELAGNADAGGETRRTPFDPRVASAMMKQHNEGSSEVIVESDR